jgi:hypothetical protein
MNYQVLYIASDIYKPEVCRVSNLWGNGEMVWEEKGSRGTLGEAGAALLFALAEKIKY